MALSDLKDLAEAGVAIRFLSGITELEDVYAQPGHHARLVSVSEEEEDCWEVCLDFSEFEDINLGFESHNYFDANGKPVLTAREAGLYSAKDSIYVNPAEWEKSFETAQDEGDVVETFRRRVDKTESFTAWLQRELIAAWKVLEDLDYRPDC